MSWAQLPSCLVTPGVKFDPLIFTFSGQEATSGVKSSLFVLVDDSIFPEDVCACQGCVPAKVHFQTWSKPTQVESVIAFMQKSSLGQVHLSCYVLHPTNITM